MTANDITQSAPGIIDAHVDYLNRVVNYIEGKISDPQAAHYTKCFLGRWIYETGLHDPAYNTSPKFQELEKLHASFHEACEQAVKYHNEGDRDMAGQKVEKARAISFEICEALIELLKL